MKSKGAIDAFPTPRSLQAAAQTLRFVLYSTLTDNTVSNTPAKKELLLNWIDLVNCIVEEEDLAIGWKAVQISREQAKYDEALQIVHESMRWTKVFDEVPESASRLPPEAADVAHSQDSFACKHSVPRAIECISHIDVLRPSMTP